MKKSKKEKQRGIYTGQKEKVREKYEEGVIESKRYRERKEEGIKCKKGKRAKGKKEGKENKNNQQIRKNNIRYDITSYGIIKCHITL